MIIFLLLDYLFVLCELGKFRGRYIHKRYKFLEDLSKFVGVEKQKLRQIIVILIKYKMFYYNYDTAFFNDRGVDYGRAKKPVNKKEESWQELMGFLNSN